MTPDCIAPKLSGSAPLHLWRVVCKLKCFLLMNILFSQRATGDPHPHFLEQHSATMSSHHGNKGLSTTPAAQAVPPLLAPGLVEAPSAQLVGC
jgi:hypothetical protein